MGDKHQMHHLSRYHRPTSFAFVLEAAICTPICTAVACPTHQTADAKQSHRLWSTSYSPIDPGAHPTVPQTLEHILQSHRPWSTSYSPTDPGAHPTVPQTLEHILQSHRPWSTSYSPTDPGAHPTVPQTLEHILQSHRPWSTSCSLALLYKLRVLDQNLDLFNIFTFFA